LKERVVVVAVGVEQDAAKPIAIELRDAGHDVIWLGAATPAAIVSASIQEAADRVVIVGNGDGADVVRRRLGTDGPKVDVRRGD